MSLEVIGAGLGRTGTLSLKLALEQLGFGPCYHMIEVFGRPDDVTVWQQAIDGDLAKAFDALPSHAGYALIGLGWPSRYHARSSRCTPMWIRRTISVSVSRPELSTDSTSVGPIR